MTFCDIKSMSARIFPGPGVSAAFFFVIEKCFKAFLIQIQLCYFVHLSKERTPLKVNVQAKEVYKLLIETIIPRISVWLRFTRDSFYISRNFVFSLACLPDLYFNLM